MSAHAWLQLAVYLAALLALAWPLARFMDSVMAGRFAAGKKLEAALFRFARVDSIRESNWRHYAIGLLVFNGLGVLAVYALQRFQAILPFNPQAIAAVAPDSAFNTAISFVTNTNWQGYSGEVGMSYLTQMLALTVQNFLSAASGIVVAVALMRGFARHSVLAIGNVWVDLTRATVWGACTAHTAAMCREPPSGADAERALRVFAGFERLRQSLAAARPDVLVIIGTDHFQSFSYDAMPIFAISHGQRFETWGDYGAPKTVHRGSEPFCDAVVGGLIEADFDVVSAAEMRLDHAFSVPLGLIKADLDVPILPIYVNCTVAPLPRLARTEAFGRALGDILGAQSIVPRVAILGTGGLSHWVGTPQSGTINQKFDLAFLTRFEAGDLAALRQWDADRIVAEAGNGAAEVRNWIVAAAAAGAPTARRIAYEPIAHWKTGIGLVAFDRP